MYALVGGASLACLLGLAVLFYAEWRRLRRAATPDAGVRLRRFGTAADREEVPRKEEGNNSVSPTKSVAKLPKNALSLHQRINDQ